MVFALYGSSEKWMTYKVNARATCKFKVTGYCGLQGQTAHSNEYGCGLVMLRNNAE